MNLKNIFVKGILPVVIIAAGFVAMKQMEKNRQAPQKTDLIEKGVLVDLLKVAKHDKQIVIVGTGTVMAGREISIIPQVSGQVVTVHPKLQSGGYINKDEVLMSIESIDYELAVEKARALLSKAEFDLASMEGRARVAKMEWERMENKGVVKPSALLLYEPQLKNAHAGLASAKAALRPRNHTPALPG